MVQVSLRIAVELYWVATTALAVLASQWRALDAFSLYGKLGSGTGLAQGAFAGRLAQAVLFVPSAVGFTSYYVIGSLWSLVLLVEVGTHVMASNSAFIGPMRALGALLEEPQAPGDADWSEWDAAALLVLLLMTAQVLRRLHECLFVHKFSASRQSMLVFVMGNLYYIFAIATPLADSGLLGAGARGLGVEQVWRLTWQRLSATRVAAFVVGLGLFGLGFVHQARCHRILADLRRDNAERAQNKAYRIPRGDWFEYVSVPHYLAEVIMYVGLAVVRFDCRSQWLVLAWVVANLSITGSRTHEWYHTKFGDAYKKLRRRIIFPFLF